MLPAPERGVGPEPSCPRTSSRGASLRDERVDDARAFGGGGRLGGKHRPRGAGGTATQDAVTFQSFESTLAAGLGAGGRLEPGHGSSSIEDEDGFTALDLVDERAEPILEFGNCGRFHKARIARLTGVASLESGDGEPNHEGHDGHGGDGGPWRRTRRGRPRIITDGRGCRDERISGGSFGAGGGRL